MLAELSGRSVKTGLKHGRLLVHDEGDVMWTVVLMCRRAQC